MYHNCCLNCLNIKIAFGSFGKFDKRADFYDKDKGLDSEDEVIASFTFSGCTTSRLNDRWVLGAVMVGGGEESSGNCFPLL